MELIQHATAWCKGEIFEGKLILAWGVLLLIMTFLFWKMGTTPYAKAMVLPLAAVAGLSCITGVFAVRSNTQRIEQFTVAHNADPVAFHAAEQARVANFMTWYPRTRWILLAVAVVGMIMAMYGTPNVRSIGLVLILLVLMGYTIDHFSEERAMIYHGQILEAVRGE